MADCVDLSRIQETSDGDIEFELELIEMYLDDAKEHVTGIQTANDAQDALKLKQVAHTLKGASANIGAVAVQGVAFKVEKSASEGDLSEMGTFIQELNKAFDETKTFYDAYVESVS